jgi:hypothetical protein
VDLVICWQDTWPDCPTEVLALEPLTRPGALPSHQRPSPGPRAAAVRRAPERPGLGDYLAPRTPRTRQLFQRLDQAIRALSPDILVRVTLGHRHVGGVGYASPKRVFVYANFQNRHGLYLEVFTRGQTWQGVRPLLAARWGALSVHTTEDLARASAIAKSSYGAIRWAIAHGEPTGMRGGRRRGRPRRGSSRRR